MRYTVAENLYGYEMNSGALRWAVVDNKPEHMSTYSPRLRGRILTPLDKVENELARKAYRFRQVAFCLHREDAEALAKVMNDAPSWYGATA